MRKRMRVAIVAAIGLAAVTAAPTVQRAAGRLAGAPAAATRPAAGDFRPFFFIQAGDPQMGMTPIPEAKARFVQLAEQANRLNAAFVLAVGDLTHSNRDTELEALDEALAAFKVPVKAVRGNHDWVEPWSKRFGKPNYTFTHNGCRFVVVDSVLLVKADTTAEEKQQARQTLEWAEKEFQQAAAEGCPHVFLVMHHPPMGWRTRDKKIEAVRKADNLVAQLVASAGRNGVRIALCGHLHLTAQIREGGVDVYTAAGTAKVFDTSGFGYRIWKVFGDHVEQEFVLLDKPPAKVEMVPKAAGAPRPAPAAAW
jgi:3',5'-cyclic AMP phosphodiesterase CpdA